MVVSNFSSSFTLVVNWNFSIQPKSILLLLLWIQVIHLDWSPRPQLLSCSTVCGYEPKIALTSSSTKFASLIYPDFWQYFKSAQVISTITFSTTLCQLYEQRSKMLFKKNSKPIPHFLERSWDNTSSQEPFPSLFWQCYATLYTFIYKYPTHCVIYHVQVWCHVPWSGKSLLWQRHCQIYGKSHNEQ